MKKIIFILIGILFILPCVVSSDMSSPVIIEYKASVNNPDGASVYVQNDDYNYVITDLVAPYGTVFTISWDDEETGYVYYEFEKYVGDETSYYVAVKDLTLIEKNYTPKESELLPFENAKVIKDVIIKTGPAEGYDSTGITIKAGTEVKIRLFGTINEEDNEAYYDSQNPWIYVEYNGIKGFINSYDATIAFREIKEDFLTDANVNIRDPKTDKVLGSVPVNTKINSKLYHVDDWSYSYYINYNGISGLVYKSDFILEDLSAKFTTTKKINIYDKLADDMENDSNKVKSIKTLDVGETFTSTYYEIYNGCRVYYDDGIIKGWAYTNIDTDDVSNSECIGLSIEYSEDEIEYEPIKKDDEKEDIPDVIEEPVVISEPSDETKTEENNNSLMILYICIVVAVLLTLVSTITIKYINKKKKESE